MALKIAFAVIIITLVSLNLGEYFNFMSIEYLYHAGQILIALSIALAMFLSEYLLYRYDHDEYSADEHIDNSDFMQLKFAKFVVRMTSLEIDRNCGIILTNTFKLLVRILVSLS